MNENMNERSADTCGHQARRHSKTFRIFVIAAAVLTIAGVTAAGAARAGFGGGHGAGLDADRIARVTQLMTQRLDLSEAQRTEIEAILIQSKEAAAPFKSELATLRDEMRDYINADEFYADQARIQLQTKANAMVELMLIGAQTMHDVRATLTPEQRAEAERLMERFGKRQGRPRFMRHKPSVPENVTTEDL